MGESHGCGTGPAGLAGAAAAGAAGFGGTAPGVPTAAGSAAVGLAVAGVDVSGDPLPAGLAAFARSSLLGGCGGLFSSAICDFYYKPERRQHEKPLTSNSLSIPMSTTRNHT